MKYFDVTCMFCHSNDHDLYVDVYQDCEGIIFYCLNCGQTEVFQDGDIQG